MAIHYRIYSGDNSGGPVDYASPVATVAGTSWTTPPLPPGSRTRFAVRSFDTITGHEDKNIDAMITVAVDATGGDATNQPAAPSGLSATVSGPGQVRVRWSYLPTPGRPDPDGFRVYRTAGPAVDWSAAPAAIVAFTAMVRDYSTLMAGLVAGTTYAIGVRSALAGVVNPAGLSAAYAVPAPIGKVSGLSASLTNMES
jgi:hypothetical protein